MSDPEPGPALSRDGFAQAREQGDTVVERFGDEPIRLILRHRAVRAAASDWNTYSSNAPQRVPIPSEEQVRSVRQIPIELAPPEHTAFRKVLEPWFHRPAKAEYIARLEDVVARALDEARAGGAIEVGFRACVAFAIARAHRASWRCRNARRRVDRVGPLGLPGGRWRRPRAKRSMPIAPRNSPAPAANPMRGIFRVPCAAKAGWTPA